eukprot:2139639-Pleurochrysis_carterae.AAC.1
MKRPRPSPRPPRLENAQRRPRRNAACKWSAGHKPPAPPRGLNARALRRALFVAREYPSSGQKNT